MENTVRPKHLLKRDGSVREFDMEKIVSAVARAGKATQEFDADCRGLPAHSRPRIPA